MHKANLWDVKCNEPFILDMEDLVKQAWWADYVRSTYGTVHVEFFKFPKPCYVKKFQTSTAYFQVVVLEPDPSYTKCTSLVFDKRKTPAKLPARISDVKNLPNRFAFQRLDHGVANSGWDPEIFVEDGAGTMIPAFQFMPSKANPLSTTFGQAYYDGFQAEFTTTPTHCHGYGFDYLRAGLITVDRAALKFNKAAKLSTKSVYRIPDLILRNATDEQVALGCLPSENAYGIPPFHAEDCRMLPYRVAGGHVHFEVGIIPDAEVPYAVKMMDLFAGLPSVGIFADIDDPLRREFYGRAGEYRRPKYGIEYRTFSNAWLCHPTVGHAVMDIARTSLSARRVKDVHALVGVTEGQVQEVINYCDVKAARKIMTKMWPVFSTLMGAYCSGNQENAMKELIFGGAGEAFPTFDAIESNWRLANTWEQHSNRGSVFFSAHVANNKAKFSRVYA